MLDAAYGVGSTEYFRAHGGYGVTLDREADGDAFARPWASFDPVRQGELVGTRADGRQVLAPRDGYVVFPNPRALAGNEWFYFAVASDRLGEDAGN
ncbi:succinylglutamate desuccinylase [Bordetella pertussis]|nr:succinylglutamate desuccinylase [Bordetella pertussis]